MRSTGPQASWSTVRWGIGGAWRNPKLVTSALGTGRRHVPKLLYGLALFGVPLAVVVVSGGIQTIGFWVVTLVWLAAAFYGAMIVGFLILLLLSPVVFRLEEVVPDRVDAVGTKVVRGFLLLGALSLYFATADLGGMAEVRLPTPWPSIGALLVLVPAVGAAYALIRLARRLRSAQDPPHPKHHGVVEPSEEFWSHQPVVAWRAWSWDGSRLHGVHARWISAEFVASCSHCDRAPSWDHVCGVYGVKKPSDVQMFHGVAAVVGRVEMWGDVIEHEHGYRASNARITGLWVGDHWRAERIKDAYPTVDVFVGSAQMSKEVA